MNLVAINNWMVVFISRHERNKSVDLIIGLDEKIFEI